MSRYPRWFFRIQAYNYCYDIFKDLLNKYEDGQLTDYLQHRQLFDSLKNCYVYYYRVLRDILKMYNIKEVLPAKILTAAQFCGECRLIDDADVWLDFIGDVNQLCQTRTQPLIECETINIIEKYKEKVENQYKILSNILVQSGIKDDKVGKELDIKTKPKYKAKEIGITKISYDKFINFLKKANCIRYVWLHGSRACGKASKSSDIDLIADLPLDKQGPIRSALYNLNVPYRIDLTSINSSDPRIVDFIRAASLEAKIIYRAEDFE